MPQRASAGVRCLSSTELLNVKLFGEAERIETRLLPKSVRRSLEKEAPGRADDRPSKDEIARALSEHDGNVAKAARALGHHRQALYRWMRAYGLDPTTFRSSP